MYDYKEAVRDDTKEAIKERYSNETIIQRIAEDRSEFESELYDELFICDSVTGNASGSYTFNAWQAEENICHNMELLEEACNEFCEDLGELVKRGAEICDVTIRCYLLGSAISDVLDEYEEDYEEAIDAIKYGENDIDE